MIGNMSLINLPSPIVRNILSFLDVVDSASYLQVVAADKVENFSPQHFLLKSNFHGSEEDCERLMLLARRSRCITFNGSLMNLQCAHFARLCCNLDLVRHLDLSGLWLTTEELERFHPVLARLKSLVYSVLIHDESEHDVTSGSRQQLSEVTEPAASVNSPPYASLRRLHVNMDVRPEFDSLTRGVCLSRTSGVCVPSCFPSFLNLEYLGLQYRHRNFSSYATSCADLRLMGSAMSLANASVLKEVCMTFKRTNMLQSVLVVYPQISKVTLLMTRYDYECVLEAIKNSLEKLNSVEEMSQTPNHSEAIEVNFVLNRPPTFPSAIRNDLPRIFEANGDQQDEYDYLYQRGNEIRTVFIFDRKKRRWYQQWKSCSMQVYELSDSNIFFTGLVGRLEEVKFLSISLSDEHGVEQMKRLLQRDAMGRCQPKRLRLSMDGFMDTEQAIDIMSDLVALMYSFTEVHELFIDGPSFFTCSDFSHVFLALKPTLTHLHIFDAKDCGPHNCKALANIEKVLACIPQIEKLVHLSICLMGRCWKGEVMPPDNLMSVLTALPAIERIHLSCPSVEFVAINEASLHTLIAKSKKLVDLTLVLPNISTSDSHLVLKRLRTTVRVINGLTNRRFKIRYVGFEQRDFLDDVQPLCDFLSRQPKFF